LIAVTRPDGQQTLAAYTDRLSLPVTVTEPGGVVWRQTYDEHGRRTSVTNPLGAVTRFGYDELGHLESVTDALGHTTRIRCNPAGLPVESTDPTGRTVGYQRDAFGRARTITDPIGGVTRLTWTADGRPATRTAPDGTVESWVYDGEGNLLTHTDELGQVSTYEYTHFETLAARTTPDGARITFTHDAHMQLVAVTNALGQRWEYEYDPAGRLIAESDFARRRAEYTLDPAGQLVAHTNAAGQRTAHRYDELGRLVATETAGRVTSYGYDRAGHLVHAANPDAEVTRVVDALGNVLAETVNGRTLTHTLDTLGRRTSRTTPGGHTSGWTYDEAGRPTALRTPGGDLGFGYDAAGREIERTVGAQLTLTTSWDARHRRTGQALHGRTAGEPALGARRYDYRPDGQLTAVDDQLTGRREFDLDPAGRVTAVRAENWTESYAYDPAGNLTDAQWPATGATSDAVGPRAYEGALLTAAGKVRYEHDAAGRVTLRQRTRLSKKPDTWRYTWDAEDRLTEVTTPDGARWRYLYDPFGRRTAKQRLDADGATVLEQTDFTWDGHTLAEQTTHAPYLPGPYTLSWDHKGLRPLTQTETIATQEQVDRRFFAIVTDLVGTPTELVDPAGTVAWRATATLWGNTVWAGDSSGYTPLRFPGQYFDPETRLHYNLHRYYDPETARYTSPDPLGLAPSSNPDAYVRNPHAWIDPLGLSPHEDAEVFYRGMSRAEYEKQLKAEGGLYPKFGETFVTQDEAYIRQLAARHPEDYEVLVQFEMQAGTRDALLAAGARDDPASQAIREKGLADLPILGRGQADRVHIKAEKGFLNFGLRKKSVDIFNGRILGYETKDW
ncbi:RHS repeat-associated core domain-containing protein, partial [Kitasatospora sp. NPDC049285]|uniref:RHS repeat-associated core domain-containing protein n=1 Tax=Kitasatospora sp. NPDC049285 TaxID=3157096 RepID=UPI00342C5604